MYYVYILLCKDGTLYTGITTNLDRRFQEHRDGKGAHYTRIHGADTLVYTELHPNRSSASKREALIKKLTRAEKDALVRGQ